MINKAQGSESRATGRPSEECGFGGAQGIQKGVGVNSTNVG